MTVTKTAASGNRGRVGRSTREAILEAASRLIHVHGYNHTSLDDVLRESGVGKGNCDYHFRTKEELGYAILDQIIASFLERTLEPCFADPEGRALSQIRCFIDRVLEAQRESNCVGGCPLGNLASELSDVHEGFRARLASVFAAWRERLTPALPTAQRGGAGDGAGRPAAGGGFPGPAPPGADSPRKPAQDTTGVC